MKSKIMLGVLILVFVGACSFPTLKTEKTETPTATLASLSSETPEIVTETVPAEPTALVVPEESATLAAPNADFSANVYLDDRSNPAAMIYSFANALNRHEFLRAYSYWIDPKVNIGTLDDFSAEFSNLASVQLSIGAIYSEGAAGSIYSIAPALFKITNSDNSLLKYYSCFTLRFPQPANYGEPPITPLNFESGSLNAMASSITDADALAGACIDADYAGLASSGTNPETQNLENLSDLSASNFIDNRSGAAEVVSSLFNAINRKEYVRAYSYWQDANAVGPYADYANGFSDTGEIKAVFGTIIADAGAGQWYYQVPVAQIVTTTGGGKQTFVGCFTLHLSNPGMQAELPFEPLGITKGHFQSVPNGTDVNSLLAQSCP